MRARALRVLATAGKCVVLGTVFVAASATGIALHSDTKPARRLVTRLANDALSGLFQGKIVVGDLTKLSLGRTLHVRAADVQVLDPDGQRVVLARGVDAKLDLGKLVGSLAAGAVPDLAFLDETRVESVEVVLDNDAAGKLGIARAFAARPSAAAKATAGAHTEDVRLSIPKVRLAHAWVHGNVTPPELDADLDDLRARLRIVDDRLTVDAEGAQLTARAPHAPSQTGPVRGLVTGSLLVPLTSSPDPQSGQAASGLVMHWELAGDAAGVPLEAHFGLDGDKLDATVDIASVAPEVLRRALPGAPLTRPMEVHAKATGTVAQLSLDAHGKLGPGAFTAQGRLGLGDEQAFQLDTKLSNVDGAALGGPTSDVSGQVHAEGQLGGGAPRGTFTVTTGPGSIAGQSAPAVTGQGSFDQRAVKGSFRASEPGAEATGTVEMRIEEQRLLFEVDARSRDLRKLARAPGVASGSVTAHATGTLDLARGTVDARVTADGSDLARAPASASNVHAQATISGPLGDPAIDVTARARRVTLAAPSAAPGDAKDKPLTYPSATAHARIVLSEGPSLRDVSVHLESAEPGTSVDAVAREVVLGPRSVEVRGASVTGLGAPLGLDMEVNDGVLSVRAKGSDIDLARLSAMTGIQELRSLPKGTRAAVDVDVKAGHGRSDGHVDVVLSGPPDGVTAELRAKLSGSHVSARARVAVGALGWLEVQRAELELPGGLSLDSARRATGALDLRGELDLAQGAALLGGERIEQITGTATVSARLERRDAGNLPTVYASAITHGLDVTLHNAGTSTRIRGIDGSVHVGYDGATDETELAALTWDAKGIIASADTKGRVPLIAWATGVKPFDRQTVGALQLSALVDIPRREVADLPSTLARPEMRGTLSAHADFAGSLDHPSVTFTAHADRLREKPAARGEAHFAPFDGVLEGRWDGDGVVASLSVDETERPSREPDPERVAAREARGVTARATERKSGHVRGLFIAALPVANLIAGRPIPWTAAGDLDVTDLELAPIPLPMRLRGALTGHVKLREIDGLPVLEAHAHVNDLGVGGARVKSGDMNIDAKDGALSANATVRQADGGGVEASIVSSSLQWRGPKMGWDNAKATHLDFKADRTQLALLRPFVRRFIPEIDGRLDGSGSATVDAHSQVFDGKLTLSEGRLYVNVLGEEISELNGIATFEPDGAFRVHDLTGKVGSGEVKASASGRMKGLRFQSADMVVVVPSKQGIPLSAEGATFAQATGELRMSATMAPDKQALLVTVEVPRSKITLPDRGTQNLQPLAPDETITVGIRRNDGSLAPVAERAGGRRRARNGGKAADETEQAAPKEKSLTAKLTVSLGDEVTLEGRGLRLGLGGRTVVDIAEEIALTGQINLGAGGTIDVQGRKFLVDRGTVTFVERDEPSNPIVIAAAYWDAPDRTRVWVEFNGPLKTGKLTLRSEPPYSKSEILSVLLFGRADPNQARAGDARPSAATAVGTGLASSGLNRALGELDEDLDVDQDQTGANRLRTKLGYRLRRNLKVQIGYAPGFSQREPDTTYLFLEWQFQPKWSVIGTRGDRGTSILDVLFRHRY